MDSSDLSLENLELTSNRTACSSKADESVRDYLEIFILSESGKPIYCYNKRDDEATLLPLCQALMNYFSNTQNDTLKYVLFKSGLKVTFSAKSPLALIVVNHQYSGVDSNLIISQLYAQIISTLTKKTLKSVYEQSAKFDLRRLLGSSEKMIDYLIENGLIRKQLKNLTNKLSVRPLTNDDKPIDRSTDRQSDSGSIDNTSNDLSNHSSIQANESDEIYCFLTSITQSHSNSVRQDASNIYKPHLNRIMIPILPINQSNRDSIANILTSSIASSSVDILYSILIKFENDPSADESTSQPNVNSDESLDPQNERNASTQSNETNVDESTETSVNQSNSTNELKNHETDLAQSELHLEDELSDELLIKEELRPTANCHLISIANQNPKITKLNTLDAHIVINLMLVLRNQLETVESLWLPVCLPRFNNSAFMHAHFCLLNLKCDEDGRRNRFGLVQLTTSKEDFDKCQLAKNIINERLSKLTIVSSPFTEINIPILHSFWYQSLRSQALVWKSKYCQNRILCKNDYLVHYMAKRMIESNLKTFWIRSDRHYIALLGWHSPNFQLYIQFDVIATKTIAINTAQKIFKWIKKEEDKILIKDYQ